MGKDPIVAGGGWIEKRVLRRPKAHVLGWACLLWFIADVMPFAFRPLSLPAFLALRFHEWTAWHWVAAGSVVTHAILAGALLVFRIAEKPVETLVRAPNPNYDSRNLY